MLILWSTLTTGLLFINSMSWEIKLFMQLENLYSTQMFYCLLLDIARGKAISFDSLKSLCLAKDAVLIERDISSLSKVHSLDVSLVTDAAHWLRRELVLTIIGFDVVIQEKAGDDVVDVNYLPSFKEIAEEVAIPAFWDALRSSHQNQKTKKFFSSQTNV